MKHLLFGLTSILLLLSLLIPCGARMLPAPEAYTSYREYISYVDRTSARRELPFGQNFIAYKQIAALGHFKEYGYNEYKNRIFYWLESKNLTFRLVISDASMYHQNHEEIPVDALVDPTDMTKADKKYFADALEGNAKILNIGHLSYSYSAVSNKDHATLSAIDIVVDDFWFQINEFSTLEKDSIGKYTLLGRLLNLETAEDALAELMADIDRGYAYEYVFAVVMAVVLVLAVLGAAIALPIVIVKRKRKKKAALAGGGENADISRDDTAPNPPTDPG